MAPKKRITKSRAHSQSIEQIKELLAREIKIGSQHDGLDDSSIALYVRQALKLYTAGNKKYQWDPKEFIAAVQNPVKFDDPSFLSEFKVPNSNVISLLRSVYTSKESLIVTLNSMCKMVKNRYRETFTYYSAIRKELSKQNKAEKLDNELTPEEEAKYISYQELMAVPDKVKKMITDSYGSVFISASDYEQMSKPKRADYLKLMFDYVALWLNVHYPLRLVWPTIFLSPVEGDPAGVNYLQGNVLHLNAFKNVRLMGPQTLQLDSKAMALIKSYLLFLTNTLGEQPKKLLWRLFNRRPGEYDYKKESSGFSKILSNLFLKYNGKPMSMNMIRHIVESHIIQSPDYAKLTNREKNDLHAKLLHSTMAANTSYNKIANRSTTTSAEPDVSFEPDAPEKPPAPTRAPQPAARRATRSQGRRERIFHGDFTPSGSDKTLEIEIFQK